MTEKRGITPSVYVVRGLAKRPGAKPVIVRRFRGENARERATDKALSLNMDLWEDLWVEPEEDQRQAVKVFSPPPKPWSARWRGATCFLVDAKGKTIACLYGTTDTKEYLAKTILEAVHHPVAALMPIETVDIERAHALCRTLGVEP